MHLPRNTTQAKSQIRIATLGTLFTMGSSVLMASFAGAAGAAPKDPKPPKYHNHGHVHVDKGAKKQELMKTSCSVRVRPHKYDEKHNDPNAVYTFTVTAVGKKPTNGKNVAVKLAHPDTPGGNVFSGGKNVKPVIADLSDIGTEAPHGKVHPNGKNDHHWHVRVNVHVTTTVGSTTVAEKDYHKDVKVYRCDPATAHNTDPALDTEQDPEDTNIPGDIDDDDNDTPVVACNAAMFGTPLPSAKPSINAGDGVAVSYIGDEDLEDGQLVVTVDGNPASVIADPQSDGTTNYWYVTSRSISNGKHTLTAQATDSSGLCGQQTVSFTVNNSANGST